MASNPYVNKVVLADGTELINISDSTAVAADVAQGKYFYLPSGEKTQGTGSGGSGDGYVWQDAQGYVHLSNEQGTQTVVEPLSVTQNGTYTAQTGHAYSPVTVNVSGGGGVSNVVTGTFEFSSSDAGSAQDINISYTGTGYPIAIMILPSEGAYNPDGTAYIPGVRYGITQYMMAKSVLVGEDAVPSYTGTWGADDGTTIYKYKSSNTSASLTNAGGTANSTYNSTGATGTIVAVFKTNKILSIAVIGTGFTYGFIPNIEYKYIIVYSS